MSVKFKFTNESFFGIGYGKYAKKEDGPPLSIYQFKTGEDLYFSKDEWHECDLGLGNLVDREIEMNYNKSTKSLQICCEGDFYIHQDENWPEEVFFLFGLLEIGDKVSLLPK